MGVAMGGVGGGAGAAVAMGTEAPRRALGGGKQVTLLIGKADLKEPLLRLSQLHWYHTSLSEKLRSTYLLFQ